MRVKGRARAALSGAASLCDAGWTQGQWSNANSMLPRHCTVGALCFACGMHAARPERRVFLAALGLLCFPLFGEKARANGGWAAHA